jgi:hypothetical protein
MLELLNEMLQLVTLAKTPPSNSYNLSEIPFKDFLLNTVG